MRAHPRAGRALVAGMALAAVVAVPILWLSGARRLSAFSDALEREHAGLERSAALEIERTSAWLDRTADLLHGERRSGDAQPTVDYAWAAGRAVALGLDILELHVDGTLASSAHWPEQAGLAHDSPAAGVRVVAVVGAAGSYPAIVVSVQSQPPGRESIRLGSFIDASFVDRIVGGRPATLRLLSRDSTAVSSSAGDPAASEGRPFRRLEMADPVSAYIEYVTPAAPRLWDTTSSVWLVAVLVGGGLFGAITTRRMGSPVGQLIEAVEAVREGRADYDFSGDRDEPWEELAAAFSRLQRSLDTQQRRRAAAERIAAWRDVARRVAHEVKNPLAPIRLTVENLQRAHKLDPALFNRLFDEGTRTILEEVDSLRRLVDEFAEFARMPQMQRESLEFRAWLAEQLELYASEPGLQLNFVAAEPVDVEIDPEQFGRVLKNLLSNAIQAMEQSATRALRIELSRQRGMVELRVADRGPGFDPETLRRAFEPYFTTRSEGTGLGLSIVERIVVEHGGWIEIGNEATGSGAWVRVVIPEAGRVE